MERRWRSRHPARVGEWQFSQDSYLTPINAAPVVILSRFVA
jgi:hypothetical protein